MKNIPGTILLQRPYVLSTSEKLMKNITLRNKSVSRS